uniref:UDENN domain-containing protein n=1 Tax=Esox lucius TaxID=8010 RepID=A0AAY5L4V5_ESOLU
MGSRIKDNPETTFEVYLEVTHPGTAGSDPEVRRRFPEDYIDQETLQTVPKFCFPFIVDSLSVSQVGQNFTFVLTDIESKQRFGFCRLSSGAHSCYCIIRACSTSCTFQGLLYFLYLPGPALLPVPSRACSTSCIFQGLLYFLYLPWPALLPVPSRACSTSCTFQGLLYFLYLPGPA